MVKSSRLGSFALNAQFGPKHLVPKATGDAETVFVILVMMVQMVLLEGFVIGRERLVMQEVVGEVVADVAEDAPAEDGRCHIPVPVEDGVCEAIEWCC